MAIDAIRTKLVTELGKITGTTRVFKDLPVVMPAEADCPCYVLSFNDPAMTISGAFNDSRADEWHFSLAYLFKPAGLGNPDENMSSVEDNITLFDAQMCANIQPSDGAGGTIWDGWNKDVGTLSFVAGMIQPAQVTGPASDVKFWGWVCNLDIYKYRTATMAAG